MVCVGVALQPMRCKQIMVNNGSILWSIPLPFVLYSNALFTVTPIIDRDCHYWQWPLLTIVDVEVNCVEQTEICLPNMAVILRNSCPLRLQVRFLFICYGTVRSISGHTRAISLRFGCRLAETRRATERSSTFHWKNFCCIIKYSLPYFVPGFFDPFLIYVTLQLQGSFFRCVNCTKAPKRY